MAEKHKESFGSYLKAGRERQELTQAALAKILHVTPAAISQFETGRSFPGPTVLKQLAIRLDLPFNELKKRRNEDKQAGDEQKQDYRAGLIPFPGDETWTGESMLIGEEMPFSDAGANSATASGDAAETMAHVKRLCDSIMTSISQKPESAQNAIYSLRLLARGLKEEL